MKHYSPATAGYVDKRDSLIWQAIKPDRRPVAIHEIGSERDVLALVAAAKRSGERISVVSGGHSYVGNGIRDAATLLDLSQLNRIEIDVAARRSTLQPGVRGFDFDSALEQHGLAFPVPHNPTVGMGGYLLGGGMGWNPESWRNLACYNIVAVEAVTAAGELVIADSQNHPELYWAARGGGPNFPGIVTRFHVEVFPRPPAIRESIYVYPIDSLASVSAWLDRINTRQPPELELTVILSATEEERQAAVPRWQCIVSAVYFADSEVAAKAMHDEVTRTRPKEEPLFKEELVSRSIGDLLMADKASLPIRHCVETVWTDDAARVLGLLAERLAASPSFATLGYINYRARPTLPADGAYSRIGKAFLFLDAAWEDAVDDAANCNWVDSLISDLAPLSRGSYINETEFIRNPSRATDAFSPESLERLRAVTRRYDPQRLFVTPINP